jgi:hypothetical protein
VSNDKSSSDSTAIGFCRWLFFYVRANRVRGARGVKIRRFNLVVRGAPHTGTQNHSVTIPEIHSMRAVRFITLLAALPTVSACGPNTLTPTQKKRLFCR